MKRLLTIAILFIAYNCNAMEPKKGISYTVMNGTGHKIKVRVRNFEGSKVLELQSFAPNEKKQYSHAESPMYRVTILHTGTSIPQGSEIIQEPEIGKFPILGEKTLSNLMFIIYYTKEGNLDYVLKKSPELEKLEKKELARAALTDLKNELNEGTDKEELIQILLDKWLTIENAGLNLKYLGKSIESDDRGAAETYINEFLKRLSE